MRLMKGATLVRRKDVNDGERREEAIEYVMNKRIGGGSGSSSAGSVCCYI